ncbi:MAG: hypothetical protein JNM67_09985 [Bacteroidetes bacterium]|nr:hypothetical protein [Bacteroidota bacterium]
MKHEVDIMPCPSCGSDEVNEIKEFKNRLLSNLVFLAVSLPFTSKKYHCSDCGNIFKSKDIAQLIRK